MLIPCGASAAAAAGDAYYFAAFAAYAAGGRPEPDGNPTGYLGGDTPAQAVRPAGWQAPMLLDLPSSYDLRAQGRVTPVRDQSPYGTCWSFAAIGAAESNLLTKGMGEADLSELQLAYYTYVRDAATANAGGGTRGDLVSYTPVMDPYGDLTVLFNRGGVTPDAVTAMANHLGLAEESAAPYGAAASALDPGLHLALAYDADAAYLQNAYVVSMQDRAMVKLLMMTQGAASIDYYHHDLFLDFVNAAYYCPGDETNHAVTLIGWDDAYPASNFKSGYYDYTATRELPPENGAWLCKNSWGSAWGKAGYFYISYADGSLCNATFLDMAQTAGHGALYQYDGGVYSAYARRPDEAAAGAQAAVFTASANAYIHAVSFYANSANMDVTASVYTDLAGSGPTTGTAHPEAVAARALDCTGYYTVLLSQPVFIRAGSRFSAVLTLSDRDGDSIDFAYDTQRTYYGVSSAPISSDGQTFWSSNGTDWEDFHTAEGGALRVKIQTLDAETPFMLGDLNGDSACTVADALLLCRRVASLGTLSGRQTLCADMTRDGRLDIRDVVGLCRRIADIPSA
ncbi:MAG: C1 family peptidase [Clostridia bacterium]|nr:C1 family peptidase [Clostridia bacterium]